MFLVPTYLFVCPDGCFAPVLQRGVTQVSKSPLLAVWLCVHSLNWESCAGPQHGEIWGWRSAGLLQPFPKGTQKRVLRG